MNVTNAHGAEAAILGRPESHQNRQVGSWELLVFYRILSRLLAAAPPVAPEALKGHLKDLKETIDLCDLTNHSFPVPDT